MKDMGTHVPFIAYWKDHTPLGRVDDSLIDFTDFYPTLAEAAEIELTTDDPVDGLSFYPQLLGEAGPKREWVLCHYQPYWNQTPGQFVRNQQYKVYRDGRLFNIGSGDLDEAQDLQSGNLPAEVEQARTNLTAVIDKAPPAPTEKGNQHTKERPTYAELSELPKPNR